MNQNIKKKIDSIMSEFHGYTDGYRMLMLMYRKKDGADKSTVVHSRYISRNAEEFEKILQSLIEDAVCECSNSREMRVYSSVNERDPKKAIREFKRRQLEHDYGNQDDMLGFYGDLKNQWISCLMKPSNRKNTTFIIDIDEEDNEKEIEEGLVKITRNFKKYSTKNGSHILTPPFNPEQLPGAKINKDGLLLLYYTKIND